LVEADFSLSLAHIVNAHAGKITVESSPGKGSEFVVHIPYSNQTRV
jgi:signal transduction histidine kinase